MTAKIIQDSTSNGKRITTLELEYPRFIHAELLTHRQFSRNSASSRAIPVERMMDLLDTQLAVPCYWGKNQPGMAAREEITEIARAETTWKFAAQTAKEFSKALLDLGLHKQIANRVTEPFQTIKVVLTATEFDNWFELRAHPDAQPEINKLAQEMQTALAESTPLEILPHDWHVPYVDRVWQNGQIYYQVGGEHCQITQARMVSASCCAQVSYRRLDHSLNKALSIAQKLVAGRPWHASPF